MHYEFGPVQFPRWWRYGRPADFWVNHLGMLERFVAEKKLEPLHTKQLPWRMEGVMSKEIRLEEGRWPWPFPYPGGMRIPHLHLKDDVFVLQQDQWKELSQSVMDGFRQRLESVEGVSFTQVMEISEAMGGLG